MANFQDNAYALLIGIAGYPSVTKLSPVVLDDARGVHAVLTDPYMGGYAASNTRLLLDEQAGAEAIRGGLDWLAQNCGPESTAFVYFSGHGARIQPAVASPDQWHGQGEYFLPYDTRIESAAELARTAVSTAEFSNALRAIQARKMIVVLDCCHAGGIGEPKEARSTVGLAVQGGLSDEALALLKSGRGRAILASSRSDEVSWLLPRYANSLFTHHLLDGLRGGIFSADGLVRVFDLFEYLQPRVTSERPDQHPVFKAELEDNFPIALASGGKLAPAPVDEQGYLYDAYLVFTPNSPDAAYVWNTLAPFLRDAGLRVAVSGAVEREGVSLVVSVERAMEQSRRTVLVLSSHYLEFDDNLVYFQGALAASIGVLERKARVLPLIIDAFPRARLPKWLASLWPLDLSDPYARSAKLERLAAVLREPVPEG